MLMNIRQILSVANERNFAVPAFNVGTTTMLTSILKCSEEKNAPVILAIHPKELAFQGDAAMAAIVSAANAARVPVTIHMDHSSTIEQILHAVRTGFTSVMMDASDKPFEENIRLTRQTVAIAHPLGITVEAELGTIGTTEHDTEGGTTEITYTNVDDAVRFVEATGIDCLAIAIGTAHGIYPKGFDPHLRLDLLSEIKERVSIPLVLHGGSANPDEEIAESVRRGINKINISSDTKDAMYQRMRQILAQDPHIREPFELYQEPIKAMEAVIRHKIDLFDAADKVQYYRF